MTDTDETLSTLNGGIKDPSLTIVVVLAMS